MTNQRARHYARAILEARMRTTTGDEHHVLGDLVADAARLEPAGTIALLANAAANGISDAVLGEGERWGNSDTYIRDALAYLWQDPGEVDSRE